MKSLEANGSPGGRFSFRPVVSRSTGIGPHGAGSIAFGLDGDDEAGHPSAANRRQQRWEPIELGHTNLEPAELRHFLRLPPSGSDPRSREAFWVRRGAEEDCPEWTPSVGLTGESSPLTAVVEEGLPCD